MKFEARLNDKMSLKIVTLKKMFSVAQNGTLSFEEYMDKEHNLLVKKSKK